MNMKQKTGKLLMAAIAAVLLLLPLAGRARRRLLLRHPKIRFPTAQPRRNRKRKAMGPIRKRMIRRRCLNSG